MFAYSWSEYKYNYSAFDYEYKNIASKYKYNSYLKFVFEYYSTLYPNLTFCIDSHSDFEAAQLLRPHQKIMID